MKPPYEISNCIVNLISKISEQVGEVKAARLTQPPTELRKKNRIKTIQSTLQIEGNTMSIDQITALLNNRRVIAPQKDILEVKNAIYVYSRLDAFDVFSVNSLLDAHKLLMAGLIDELGKLRNTSVGIVKGEQVTHIAPPGQMVFPLINDLFEYIRNHEDLLLLKSCVFHYEFEFIHPFLDGNGRMGRLWQTLILKKYSKVFEFLPIELLIKHRQKEYYNVLSKSDKQGSSTFFIEFMLEIIHQALDDLLKTQNLNTSEVDRIELFSQIIGDQLFSRQNYLRHNKDISTATASRDLKYAVEKGLLKKLGEKRMTRYVFVGVFQ